MKNASSASQNCGIYYFIFDDIASLADKEFDTDTTTVTTIASFGTPSDDYVKPPIQMNTNENNLSFICSLCS